MMKISLANITSFHVLHALDARHRTSVDLKLQFVGYFGSKTFLMAKGLFIGLTTVDLIYYLPTHPEEDSKNNATFCTIDIGGPATNAAYTYTALGGEATLISVVGNHAFRIHIQSKIAQYGIDHIDLGENTEVDPIVSSILVNTTNGKRTVISKVPSHSPQQAPTIDPDLFDVILMDGFYPKTALPILKHCRSDIPIVFDGGSFKPGTEDLLTYSDYPIMASGFCFPNERNLDLGMQNLGKSQYAITDGAAPIRVFADSREHMIPVEKIEAMDTLGAGDILHGAFAYFISSGNLDFIEALTKASEAATLSCRFRGARAWVSSWENSQPAGK